eukprot:m.280670 g.280670  ORF g.280670 m.280670 type:complete len:57 (-) comp26975_c1_seq1:4253-4423(-)
MNNFGGCGRARGWEPGSGDEATPFTCIAFALHVEAIALSHLDVKFESSLHVAPGHV